MRSIVFDICACQDVVQMAGGNRVRCELRNCKAKQRISALGNEPELSHWHSPKIQKLICFTVSIAFVVKRFGGESLEVKQMKPIFICSCEKASPLTFGTRRKLCIIWFPVS